MSHGNEIKTIGVIGAGFMGAELAYVATVSGFNVLMKDANMELAEKGKQKIEYIYNKQISKGRVEKEQMEKGLTLIKLVDIYEGLKDVDFVIEAVSEDIKLKEKVHQDLDKVCPEHCIIASNTSNISITKLAAATHRPDRFIGMHFFSPARVMKLVEVIPGMETSDKTMSITLELAGKMGKEPVKLKNECVGFIVNRLLQIFEDEAIALVEEGVASVEDIDKAVKLGLGHPMGPFELMDFTGMQLQLDSSEIMFAEYGERYIPRPLLRRMVSAGRFGIKAGKGWYDYPEK